MEATEFTTEIANHFFAMSPRENQWGGWDLGKYGRLTQEDPELNAVVFTRFDDRHEHVVAYQVTFGQGTPTHVIVQAVRDCMSNGT